MSAGRGLATLLLLFLAASLAPCAQCAQTRQPSLLKRAHVSRGAPLLLPQPQGSLQDYPGQQSGEESEEEGFRLEFGRDAGGAQAGPVQQVTVHSGQEIDSTEPRGRAATHGQRQRRRLTSTPWVGTQIVLYNAANYVMAQTGQTAVTLTNPAACTNLASPVLGAVKSFIIKWNVKDSHAVHSMCSSVGLYGSTNCAGSYTMVTVSPVDPTLYIYTDYKYPSLTGLSVKSVKCVIYTSTQPPPSPPPSPPPPSPPPRPPPPSPPPPSPPRSSPPPSPPPLPPPSPPSLSNPSPIPSPSITSSPPPMLPSSPPPKMGSPPPPLDSCSQYCASYYGNSHCQLISGTNYCVCDDQNAFVNGKCVYPCSPVCPSDQNCNATYSNWIFCQCNNPALVVQNGACVDLCAGKSCPANSVCWQGDCVCNSGLTLQYYYDAPSSSYLQRCVDPCAGNKCPSGTTCQVIGTAPYCKCPTGQHLVNNVCSTTSVSFSDWLDPHNEARAVLGLPALSWDTVAAARAQNWSNVLLARYPNCDLYDHGDTAGPPQLGQNGAWGGISDNSAAVRLWVDEWIYYTYGAFPNYCAPVNWPGSNSLVECGHYTQVMWKPATGLGCATVTCANGEVSTTCNYSPPGNYLTQYPW